VNKFEQMNKFKKIVNAIKETAKVLVLLLCALFLSVAIWHTIGIHYRVVDQLMETTNIQRLLTDALLQEARLRRSDDQLYAELLEVLMRRSR